MIAAEAEIEVTVASRHDAADDVVVIDLRAGVPLPAWSAGAHVDLVLGDDLVRQYSLCGDPADASSWRLAILHEPAGRGGSVHVVTQVREGSRLKVRGPRNHFRLEPAGGYLFVAGGIGITPIVPMLIEASRAGIPWSLAYGGRSRSAMAFADELVATYGTDAVTLVPQDESGLLDLAALFGAVGPDMLVYCCGPSGLLDAAAATAAELLPPGALRVERFSPIDREPAGAEAFEVHLARSDLTLTVPADRSILDLLDEAGIFVPTSCEEGTCGTCQTAVLDGIPDHRDSVLTDAERAAGDTMLVCCSRSVGPQLTLDL